MPFLRYTRDKRGYETTFVMHAYRSGNGGKNRVLYLFRSPAYVRIGRQPLDDEAREALTHTHPDLTFDWNALDREAVVTRYEPPPPGKTRKPPGRQAQSQAPSIQDDTTLGRTLGAGEAARLRSEYAALLDRISRRARTPEDRDRLLERAERLNPDDWADAEAVTAGRKTLEVDWGAIRAELPSRRRGRRGDRPNEPDNGAADPESAASGIMGETEESHATLLESPDALGGRAHESGDGHGLGSEPDPDIGSADDLQYDE